eukprot:6817916-Prymnesium_polylepis.1
MLPSSCCGLAVEEHVEPAQDVALAEQPAELAALERHAFRRSGGGRLRLGRHHERGKKCRVRRTRRQTKEKCPRQVFILQAFNFRGANLVTYQKEHRTRATGRGIPAYLAMKALTTFGVFSFGTNII